MKDSEAMPDDNESERPDADEDVHLGIDEDERKRQATMEIGRRMRKLSF